MSALWKIFNLVCKLPKMELCGNPPTPHVPPPSNSAVGESHRNQRSETLIFTWPLEPHFKNSHLECVFQWCIFPSKIRTTITMKVVIINVHNILH